MFFEGKRSKMKNNQGFTIVELVIVIAVVAILAAVMIQTFATIIKRANISSDIQTARNMGVILTAEKPQNAYEAVAALKKNGFKSLHPKTKFYSFFGFKAKTLSFSQPRACARSSLRKWRMPYSIPTIGLI